MMKKSIFFCFFFLGFYLNSTSAIECIPVGCSSCLKTACDVCEPEYELNSLTHTCSYTMCETFQFYQKDSNACQSICNLGTNPSPTSKTCEQSNQCPLSFVQQAGTNKSSSIKFIVDSANNQLFLIYQSFVNVVDKLKGSFQRQYTFNTSIISVLIFPFRYSSQTPQKIYLISEHAISLWNPEENEIDQVLSIPSSSLRADSSIFIAVYNNRSRFVVTSFDISSKIITLTEITNSQEIISVITMTSQQVVTFTETEIIIKNQDNFINQIIQVVEELSLGKLKLSQSFSQPVCGNQQILSNLQQVLSNDVFFFLILKSTSGIFQLQKESQICNYFPTNSIPTRMISSSFVIRTANITYIAVSFSDNSIQLLSTPNLTTIHSFTTNQIPLDFFIPTTTSSSLSIYVLTSDQTKLINYSFIINSSSSLQLSQTTYCDILITSASSLIYLPEAISAIVPGIAIINQDLQLISTDNFQTQMLIKDFKNKVYQNEGSMTSIAYSEKLSLILTCSAEGSLLVWSSIDTMAPIFMYRILKSGQKCKTALIFKFQYAVVLFANEIQIFNILNPQDIEIISIIDSTALAVIQKTDDLIYILKDNRILIYRGINDLVYDSSSVPLLFNGTTSFTAISTSVLLTVTNSKIISIFTVLSDNTISPTPAYTYTAPDIIIFQKVIIKSNGSFSIFLNDQLRRLVTLDQTLTEIYVKSKPEGAVFALYTIDEESKFFILFKLSDTTLAYRIQLLFIETLTNKEYFIDKFISILGLAQLQKRKNNINQIGYAMIAVLPFGYMSLSLEAWWINPSDDQMGALAASSTQNGVTSFGAFSYTSLQNIVTLLPNSKQNLMLTGMGSGEARVSLMAQTGHVKIIASALSSATKDLITSVRPNFYQGYLFVLSNSIACYSLHTNLLIERISFSSNTGNSVSVLQFYPAKLSHIFIACVPLELLLKNFETQEIKRLSTISPPQGFTMTYINGFYFEESLSLLYIYGDGFYTAKTPLLTEINKISSYSFQTCKFESSLIVCRVNSNQILLLDPAANLSQIQIITLSSTIGSFDLQIDSTNQYFFAFNTIFQAYSYKGVLLSTTTYASTITSVNLCGQNIALVTKSFVYFYQRSTLKYIVYITPSGGSILGTLYIEEYNMYLYYCDETRYGQVFLYSLDTFQQAGSISNSYTNNGIGYVVTSYYDNDNGMFGYIDRLGNSQIVSFSGARTTTNTIGVEEIQIGVQIAPTNQVIDYNTNNVYIHNGANVWKFNYNLLTRSKQRLMRKKQKLFLLKNNSYFIVDYQNTILSFSDQKVSYSSDFLKPIIHLETLKTSQLLLLILNDQILVYPLSVSKISRDNYSKELSDMYTNQILLSETDIFNPSNDRVLLLTYSNRIIDYNFQANIEISHFDISSNETISTSLSLKSSSDWLFVFGTNTGRYGFYNLKTKTSFIASPPSGLEFIPIQMIKQFSNNSTSVLVVYRSGNILSLNLLANNIQFSSDSSIPDLVNLINSEIRPLSFLHFNSVFSRIMINFENQKAIYVYNQNSLNNVAQISFPDDQLNRIFENTLYLVLASVCQVNVYKQSDLSQISRVRRSNRLDRILDVKLIEPNILIIVFTLRIEVLLIQSASIILAETIDSVTDPQLIQAEIFSDQTLHIIGSSKVALFEKVISLSLYNQAYSAKLSSQTTVQNCVATIPYTNTVSAQNSLDYTTSSSSLMTNLNYIFQVQISKQLNNLAFLSRVNMQVIISPSSSSSSTLNLYQQSFQNIPFNVFINSFKFIFAETGSQLDFHTSSSNITLQNIIISDATLPSGTSLLFSNKKVVQIQSLTIDSIKLLAPAVTQKSKKRNLLLGDTTIVPFLSFKSCTYVIIEDLVIINSSISGIFLSSYKSTQIIIKNVKLTNSLVNGLAQFTQDSNVLIKNIQISNCYGPVGSINKLSLITVIGVEHLQIENLKMKSNDELVLIETNKQFIEDNMNISLLSDYVSFSDFILESNTFSLSFTKDNQPHLIQLESSVIYVKGISYSNNTGNLYVKSGVKLELSEGQFKQNQGVVGSCVQIESTETFSIDKTNFIENSAFASGGAVFILNVDYLTVTENTIFESNSAQIGGAIRLQSDSVVNMDTSMIKAKFNLNNAAMFGSDIGTYLNKFTLYQSNSNSSTTDYSPIFSGNIFNLEEEPLISFNPAQSGGLLLLKIEATDSSEQIFTFDLKKYQNLEYSSLIIQELNKYQIELYQDYSEVSSTAETENFEIKGQSLIYSKQFDQELKGFMFNSLTVSSYPQQTVTIAKIKLNLNPFIQPTGIHLSIPFRDCIAGEIYSKESSNIIVCSACLEGTYSLRKPESIPIYLSDRIEKYDSCKTCPYSAKKCSGNQIVLKTGYWRVDSNSDEIVACSSIDSSVCDESNTFAKSGCLGGHVGPLCESCDVAMSVWNGKRYASSIQSQSCNECSDVGYQILILASGMILIIAYLISSVLLFMNDYMQNSTCVYLRRMKILPLSRSSVQDESAFFIKSLLNYFQLSAQLFTFTIPFIPDSVQVVPLVAGQPVSKFIVSSSCIFNQETLTQYGDERIRAISQSLYPIGIFLAILIFLEVCSKLKRFDVSSYHKYTMVNVVFFFFQPDSIAFFTKGLSCRLIGEQKYQAINLIIPCDDSSYNSFRIWFILPNLLFWVFFPIYIFFQFRKKVNEESLDYCTMKYRFGFFFIGLRKEYYYWEFVRVYLKMIIVVIITLLKDYGNMVYIGCSLLISLYIVTVQNVQPFQNKHLLKLEVLSYMILVPNIFFSQLSLQYDYDVFQVFIMIGHFGYLFYTVIVIVKYKVNSQQKGANRMLRVFLKFILPQHIYNLITKSRFKNHYLALMRWRTVYQNIDIICHKNHARLSEIRATRTTNSNMLSPVKKQYKSIQIPHIDLQKENLNNSVFSETPSMSSVTLSPVSNRLHHFNLEGARKSLAILTNNPPQNSDR